MIIMIRVMIMMTRMILETTLSLTVFKTQKNSNNSRIQVLYYRDCIDIIP